MKKNKIALHSNILEIPFTRKFHS